jgi:hypothetical protein
MTVAQEQTIEPIITEPMELYASIASLGRDRFFWIVGEWGEWDKVLATGYAPSRVLCRAGRL